LSGKVALITGASRGIGAATAIKFADAGVSVVVHYSSHEEEAARVVDQARCRGVSAIAVQADVARFNDVAALFKQATDELGAIDILVANAGVWKRGPIDELKEDAWDETIDVNLKGVYACCHFAARQMKQRRSGRIITVSSTAGQRGEPFYSHYAASKGGIIAFTKSLAGELGPHGITVNCVAPGWVDTDMSADPIKNPLEAEKILTTIPLGRVASPEDIAGPILFLASDLAGNITGEVLNVNGGSVLCG
jgi:3-oxoacyl-[acyl-carrier protein] reductase